MKKFLFWFCFFYFLFCFSIFSSNKIAFLDIDLIFKNSIEYKNFIKKINIDINLNYFNFNKIINKIIKEEKFLKNKFKFIDNKKLKFIRSNLNYIKSKLYNDIRFMELKYNKEIINIHNKIFYKIKKILILFSKKNKYNLVLDINSIIFHDKNIVDITKVIIKKLNSFN